LKVEFGQDYPRRSNERHGDKNINDQKEKLRHGLSI
jgi:hypothetical protein